MMPLKIIAAFLLLSFSLATAQVKVWHGTLTLPTYEEGAPDPNPPFDQYANSRFNYPYTLRDRLTDLRKDHAWRAIFLENEYLKCSVLPDLGGHVYNTIAGAYLLSYLRLRSGSIWPPVLAHASGNTMLLWAFNGFTAAGPFWKGEFGLLFTSLPVLILLIMRPAWTVHYWPQS